MTEGPPPPSRTASGGPVRRITVFACGEAQRGDDAAGFLAAELLQTWLDQEGQEGRAETTPPTSVRGALQVLRGRIEVRPVGQLEPDDLLAVGSDEAVVVVDAVRGVRAGSVVRRPLAELASGGPAPRSSHMLPLRDVLELVATLRGSLPAGVFVGLGGSVFGLGEPVSAAVLEALPSCATAMIGEAARLARG